MPEGDTIFRTARALGRALIGKHVTAFTSNFAMLTRFNDDTPLTGQTIVQVESRGKWVLIHFSGVNTVVDYAPAIFQSAGWKAARRQGIFDVANKVLVLELRIFRAAGDG